MKENRILPRKRRFSTRFRVTVMTKPFLKENDTKRILHQTRLFSSRFRVTVID